MPRSHVAGAWGGPGTGASLSVLHQPSSHFSCRWGTRGPGGATSAVCRAGAEVLGAVHTDSFSVKVQGQRSRPMFVLCLAHFPFGTDPGSEEGEGKMRLSCDPQVVTV